jgi:ATP/maltotriose-dependent transcriptional regulator MalT/two-component SAPR family response regulator
MDKKKLKAYTKKDQLEGFDKGINFPLIETKIQVPKQRSDLLLRTRLVNKLHSYLDRKLIVISAPAGYGKTSLMTNFAADTDLPICWYTIDTFDRDLHVFLEYLIASINHRFPDFGERSHALLVQTPDPSKNLYQIVATIVKEIDETIPEYFILVLDDQHTVEDQDDISEFIDRFVSYVDENCHVVILSRSLPALPNFALLVARRQAAGLGIDDLRFTPQEIQSLAAQNHNHQISLTHANEIVQKIGGWITGIQLMDPNEWDKNISLDEQNGYINDHIYEYLSSQVLNQQPKELRTFLLESSILDEINPEICRNVLAIDNPTEFIEQLRTKNLYIIEYTDALDHVRYNDLFREFLRSSFRRRNRARYQELMLRTADYYASQHEWDRAINRYHALGEYDSMFAIINKIPNFMFDSGRWATLARWIDALPDKYLEKSPQLLIVRAKIHAENGELSTALRLLERAEKVSTSLNDKAYAAQALAFKGSIYRFQGNYAQAIAQCQQAFALVSGNSKGEQVSTALAHKNIGLSLIRLGQINEGRQALHRALHIYEELIMPQDSGMVHHDLGLSLELTGDLEGAILHYKAALEKWKEIGNLSPWANTLNGLGVVYQQMGNYDLAKSYLEEALNKAQQAQDLRIEAYTLTSMADLYREKAAYEQAKQFYRQALSVGQRAHIGFITTCALDGLGNIARLQSDFPNARNRIFEALELAEEHNSAYEKGMCYISMAVLANQERELATAVKYLDQAIYTLEASDLKQQLGIACLHRANTAYLSQDFDKALGYLERSLAITDQLGYDHFIVVNSLDAYPVIRYAQTQGLRENQLKDILNRIKKHKSLTEQDVRIKPKIEEQLTLKILGFGKPSVVLDDQTVQWAIAKSQELFFFLLQNPKGLSKEQIGAIFWPDHPPERLDSAFRSTLYRLRRVVFRDSVIFENGLYHFNWLSDYWYDVQEFEDLLDKAATSTDSEYKAQLINSALELYRGEYMQGTYENWVSTERQRLRRRYLTSLETLAGMYAEMRKLSRAIELYRRLLKEDPFQEVAHRELMRCYYRQGDRAAAIRQYQACIIMLRDELGLMPSPETEELYLHIIR